jgi:hypothetical protein
MGHCRNNQQLQLQSHRKTDVLAVCNLKSIQKLLKFERFASCYNVLEVDHVPLRADDMANTVMWAPCHFGNSRFGREHWRSKVWRRESKPYILQSKQGRRRPAVRDGPPHCWLIVAGRAPQGRTRLSSLSTGDSQISSSSFRAALPSPSDNGFHTIEDKAMCVKTSL